MCATPRRRKPASPAGLAAPRSTAIRGGGAGGREQRGDAEHPPEIRCADQEREQEQQMVVAGQNVRDAEAEKTSQPGRARGAEIDRDPRWRCGGPGTTGGCGAPARNSLRRPRTRTGTANGRSRSECARRRGGENQPARPGSRRRDRPRSAVEVRGAGNNGGMRSTRQKFVAPTKNANRNSKWS